MRGKPAHRISRLCTGRQPPGLVPEFKSGGDALFVVHRLQRRGSPRLCLRSSDRVRRLAGFSSNGARRGIGDRILPTRGCSRTCRLHCSIAREFLPATDHGRPEFLRGFADDHAERYSEVSSAFRASAARSDPTLRFARQTAAPLDSIQVIALAHHDQEVSKLGPALGRDQ